MKATSRLFKMKAFGVLLFALCTTFVLCEEKCTWDGYKETKYDSTCAMLKEACGNGQLRIIKCGSGAPPSSYDRKEEPSCFLDLQTRKPVKKSRCEVALWACTKYEFVTKKTEFAFVHPGECGNCERHVVCPWTRKGREVKKEEKKGWRKWVSKVGSGLKKALEKTKNVVNKELHNFGKVCTFDGEEFKDRCQFMQARCKVFASKNIILAPAMKKMFSKVRKCTDAAENMDKNAERLMKGPPKF